MSFYASTSTVSTTTTGYKDVSNNTEEALTRNAEMVRYHELPISRT
ncbi:Protein of unknown function [Pyronema omphalodes CBS 100304]|uniref:Uncharacterized protein n=1 Tax=Pyronema omphalodes (strain CBS 100304) TaxID=1076935 RepID=U4LFN9_PYROM|nr:Protein of unknown function [Pyronema omphalodes CBS 100304]